VIVPEPGYQAYIGGALLAGGTPHIVPLRAEQHFLLELDELAPEVLQRTALVYVNYPNNPTAAVAPLDYLERLVAACQRHDIVLAYDNPYCDVTFDGYVAPSIFEVSGARDVAVEFFSMSKSFKMTGWRVGFAVGNANLIGALSKVKSYVDTGAFQALQAASAWTLDHAEELIPPLVAELTRRRDAAVTALGAIGLPVDPPRGAMYLWVPLPAGIQSGEFANRALEEEGVVVLPGSGFGASGEGFFRIALTVAPDRLQEAVERLGRTLAACRDGQVAAAG
jgi:LL-diaminopimelate aminotransferase